MKKTLLFLLLAVASGPAAFAQAAPGGSQSSKDYTGGAVTESGNTGFGVKGGYSLSNFRGDGADGIDGRKSLNNFHAGVYGQFGFNDFSSVQVELLYSRKGVEFNDGTGGGKQELRLDYLSVPVLYVGNITENISFHVGPQLSLLTKIKSAGEDLDIEENGFNSLDLGGVAGLEARVGPARIGARYDLGFSKLLEDSSFSDGDVRNNTFQVYVGIGITQ
jgi:hypothetical protein